MEEIIDNGLNVSCSFSTKMEGEEKMSNIVIYNNGDYALIASDSRNMRGNIIHSDEYQKIFPFNNLLIGVYGVTTFIGENSFREEVGDIIKRCVRNNTREELIDEIISELSYRNIGDGTGLIFIYILKKGIQIKKVFITREKSTIEILSSVADSAYTFGTFYISCFISEKVSTVDGIKEMIRINAKADSFVHMPAVINDKVQVYKISKEKGIENFSDFPFN